MERSWMEVGCVKVPFSHMYDHSLPHSRLAIGDVEGEWRTRAPIGSSCSSPCSRLLSDYASDPLAKLMKWVAESSPAAVTRRSGKTATLRL
ncbi:unnamed protein product [Spirodela intermedia]|uniref:Uncharacterized protein n=1 Tax=Spirodela intermedia TaxID=51605 RepID=A0A7I8LJF9_SPIIN|nr:unnamed protein product [Spirodela intermedia]